MNLIALLCGLAVTAILAGEAVPSYVHMNNQAQIQTVAATFERTYNQLPVLPPDPSWSVAGNTWSTVLTRPAGVTLSISTPLTTGGRFVCTVSGDPTYRAPRC